MRAFTYELYYPHFALKRKGMVIHWEGERWGEAAPLPGWSKENLDEVITTLLSNNKNSSPPSLAFAGDAKSFTPLSLPICGLLAGSKEQILHDAKVLHQQGVRHAKLKVKGLSLDDAISLTNHLAKSFCLRIDFNRSLALDEALFFAENIDLNAIEFFEEPLKNPKDLCFFPYPIALDESLREEQHHELTSLEHVKALVIKPTMTGSIAACKQWAHLKKPIVLSSSFESGIGILQIMQCALEFTDQLAPLGLDTYRYLKEDLLEEPLLFEGGFVHTPKNFIIKHHLLKAV